MELHGGRVGLKSEGKGKGCEFYVDLELKQRPSDMTPLPQIPPVDSTTCEVMTHDIAIRHELMRLDEKRSQIIQNCISSEAYFPERTERSCSGKLLFNRLRVLVVDDSSPTRKMAIRLLSASDCQCSEASDGDEAVDKIFHMQDGEFDVLLME